VSRADRIMTVVALMLWCAVVAYGLNWLREGMAM
jgi:hypothetical protein